MNKLSNKDEKRALAALTKCASETKDLDGGELQDKAYAILSKELGDKPELLKRACEGYNSSKSIYRLSSSDDNHRGDTFGILDAPALYERAKRDLHSNAIQKAASANGIKKINFFTERVATGSIKKVASHTPVAKKEPEQVLTIAQIEAKLKEELDILPSIIRKSASNMRFAGNALTDAISRCMSTIALEPAHIRKEAAEYLHASKGIFADNLIAMFNDSHPMQKVASFNKNKFKGSVRLPAGDIYSSVSEVENKNELYKTASEFHKLCLEQSTQTLKDAFAIGQSLRKDAALVPFPVAGSSGELTRALVGTELAKGIPQILGLTDPDEEKLRGKINTSELVNALKAIGVRRAFMNTVNDDVVSRYPLEDIVKAFNDTMAETSINMRDVPATAQNALIKSRVIARLARGNAASGADTNEVRENEKIYGKIPFKSGFASGVANKYSEEQYA